MGYFTETMETLIETKSQIKSGYDVMRQEDRLMGDHDISKLKSKRERRDYYIKAHSPMKTAQDYRNREAAAKDMSKEADEFGKMKGKDFRAAAKGCRESSIIEYFDSAFEEACGGGGKKKKKENKGGCGSSKKGGCQ